MEPEKLPNATNEELVQAYIDAGIKEEELKAEKDAIKEELLARMKTDAMMVGSYAVNKIKRVSFKTTIDDARNLGAVKEAVDTDVLKKLYQNGVDVPGSAVTVYIQVREVTKKE